MPLFSNSCEQLVENIDRLHSFIEKIFVKGEPGYPDLDHIYKASYVRSLLCRKQPAQKTLLVGYEGFDIEIWRLYDRKIRCLLLKKQGYKSLNSNLGHDVTNRIRNRFLEKLSSFYDKITQEYFHFPEKFINNFYLNILNEEKKFISQFADPDQFIYNLRVTASLEVSIAHGDIEETVNIARRQAVIAAKHLQLLSLHSINQCADAFSLKRMVAAIRLQERGKLERTLTAALGDRVMINKVSHNGKDIGQYVTYNSEMESPFFLQKIKSSWPILANTLTEVYNTPHFDMDFHMRLQNRFKRSLKKMNSGLKARDYLRFWTGFPDGGGMKTKPSGCSCIEKIAGGSFRVLAEMIKKNITRDNKYMSNDIYAKYLINDAILNKKTLYVINSDREGILFLNAHLGVETVDRGLNKESLIYQRVLSKLKTAIEDLDPKVPVHINYARRNIDENVVVISIDSEPEAAIEEMIKGHFAEIDNLTGELEEFKYTKGENIFDSISGGCLVRISFRADSFRDAEQVLQTVDFLGDRYKRKRRELFDRLIACDTKDSPPPYFSRNRKGNVSIIFNSEMQKQHIETVLNEIRNIFSIEETPQIENGAFQMYKIPGIIYLQEYIQKGALLPFLGIYLRNEGIETIFDGASVSRDGIPQNTTETVCAPFFYFINQTLFNIISG